MYEEELTFFERNKNNIRYHIVESPQNETEHYFSAGDNNSIHNCDKQNETLVLAFHSSLLCFKIALCVLL
jgi:hypothetical protein